MRENLKKSETEKLVKGMTRTEIREKYATGEMYSREGGVRVPLYRGKLKDIKDICQYIVLKDGLYFYLEHAEGNLLKGDESPNWANINQDEEVDFILPVETNDIWISIGLKALRKVFNIKTDGS